MYMLKSTAKSQINKIRIYKEKVVKNIQLIKNKKEKEGKKQRMEKILNIAHYYRNANQNYNKVSPHMDQNGHHQNICKQ